MVAGMLQARLAEETSVLVIGAIETALKSL
jgi:hypothetical protein